LRLLARTRRSQAAWAGGVCGNRSRAWYASSNVCWTTPDASRRTSAPPRPGVGYPVAPAGRLRRRRQEIPSSWETPIVRSPCSIDAGRTVDTRPLQCRSVAPGMGKAKAPAKGLSTLHSMAFGLAVYASPHGLPRHDARLASSRWSTHHAAAAARQRQGTGQSVHQ
jgi:hypothetical protein